MMEYKKMINFLDNAPNQLSKFRTKNRIEINAKSRGTYIANNDFKFKTSMIRTVLCDNSDAYIHVKGTITVPTTADASAPVSNSNKKVIFKNSAPFNNCTSEINNTKVDDGQNIEIVMPVYNLIEYSDVFK